MVEPTSSDWGDAGLVSLLRSPFLIPSVLFHTMLFLLALRAVTLPVAKTEDTPISVQLLEIRDGGSSNKSIGAGSGPGGPRTMPKLGTPTPPTQRSGKLDSGSSETSVPSSSPVEAAPAPKPVTLPGPKVLAADQHSESVNVKETSVDSLVRLPTKESPTHLPGSSAADLEANQKSSGCAQRRRRRTRHQRAERRRANSRRAQRDWHGVGSLRRPRRKSERKRLGWKRHGRGQRRRQHDRAEGHVERRLQSISQSTEETRRVGLEISGRRRRSTKSCDCYSHSIKPADLCALKFWTRPMPD